MPIAFWIFVGFVGGCTYLILVTLLTIYVLNRTSNK